MLDIQQAHVVLRPTLEDGARQVLADKARAAIERPLITRAGAHTEIRQTSGRKNPSFRVSLNSVSGIIGKINFRYRSDILVA
jgi:hypothetical protein